VTPCGGITIDPERVARPLAILGFVLLAAGLLPMSWWMVPLAGAGLFCLVLSCVSRSDGFLLFGPLGTLQNIRASQRPRRWVIRTVIVLGTSVAALIGIFSGRRGALEDPNAIAEMNNQLTSTIGILLFLYVAVLTLNVMCGLVAKLKQMKQWDLLRATDLRRREIIGGLVFGNLPRIFEPIFAVTPILMMLPLFGGVSPWFPMVVLVGCAAFAFGLANMAVCFGLRSKRAATAGAKCIGLYFAYFVVAALFSQSSTVSFVASGVPYYLTYEAVLFESTEAYWLYIFARFTAFHFLVGVFFFLVSTQRVDEPDVVEMPIGPPQEKQEYARPVEVQYVSPEVEIVNVVEHVERPPMWEDNPIAWWTAHGWMNRTQAGFAMTMSLRIVTFLSAGFFVLCLFARCGTALSALVFIPGILIPGICACACLFPALFRAAGCIVDEKKADTWDPLLLTPYSRKEIVLQKFWGVFQSDRPAYLCLVGAMLPATLTGFIPLSVGMPLMLGTPMLVASLTAIGLFASARAKTKTTSIILALVIVFGFWLLAIGFASFFNFGATFNLATIIMGAVIPPALATTSTTYYGGSGLWMAALILGAVLHFAITRLFIRLAVVHVQDGEPS
jgi:ABC-2 family transporter protein